MMAWNWAKTSGLKIAECFVRDGLLNIYIYINEPSAACIKCDVSLNLQLSYLLFVHHPTF